MYHNIVIIISIIASPNIFTQVIFFCTSRFLNVTQYLLMTRQPTEWFTYCHFKTWIAAIQWLFATTFLQTAVLFWTVKEVTTPQCYHLLLHEFLSVTGQPNLRQPGTCVCLGKQAGLGSKAKRDQEERGGCAERRGAQQERSLGFTDREIEVCFPLPATLRLCLFNSERPFLPLRSPDKGRRYSRSCTLLGYSNVQHKLLPLQHLSLHCI